VRYYIIGNLTVDLIGDSVRGGGPGYYAGLAIATLGDKAVLIGNVGRDYPKEEINRLQEYNVDLSLLNLVNRSTRFRIEYHGSQRKLILADQGELIEESVIPWNDLASSITIISPVINEISLNLLKRILRRSNYVTIDLQGFVRYTDHEGVISYYWSEEFNEIISSSLIVHASEEEVRGLSSDPVEAANKLLDMGAEYVAVTMGVRGSIVGWDNEVYHIPPMGVFHGDPTGAGDVYLAVATVALTRNMSALEAFTLATVASGLRVLRGKPPWYSKEQLFSEAQKIMNYIRRT